MKSYTAQKRLLATHTTTMLSVSMLKPYWEGTISQGKWTVHAIRALDAGIVNI